jgi:hypothetical protein
MPTLRALRVDPITALRSEWERLSTTLLRIQTPKVLLLAVFSAFLNRADAQRASDVVEKLLGNGFRSCALTGGLAIEAHLRAHGRPTGRRALNDVDLVVESFDAIPVRLADRFLLNHIHPRAREGKTLLQLIDRKRALRVDLFGACGTTLSRAAVLDEQTGLLPVLAVEDLVARTAAHVCGRLRKGRAIDVKYVRAFTRLAGLGTPHQLAEAWRDHREDVPGTLEDATQEAHHLMARHPNLLIVCDQCENFGPFRLASPDVIVNILGYWWFDGRE